MAKFGMKKGSIHDRADAEQVAHQHVPGRAYEVGDPVAKLIHTIGGGFFNEPKYYDSQRRAAAFFGELLSTGRIASTIVDEAGLTEQAREVLEKLWPQICVYLSFSRSKVTRIISLPAGEENSVGRSFPGGAKHSRRVFLPSS